ncbi:MAG: hypothetical protein KDD11_09775 [Acidobacteria bacterium]|nr:hypothetical protein [Acidobacteriota bacterium]
MTPAQELWPVVGVLAVGYLLLLVELFVPGGVLGAFGVLVVLYGCFLAFGMGPLWGTSAILLSAIVTTVGLKLFFRSRVGRALVLDDPTTSTWRAQDEDFTPLVGRCGRALTSLRPAGAAEIDGRRYDVVTDGEMVAVGTLVMVVEAEGARLVVAPATELTTDSRPASTPGPTTEETTST